MKNLKTLYFSFLIAVIAIIPQLAQSQCGQTVHTEVQEDSWLSCTNTDNPNPDRTPGKWLMYDLGYLYQINATHIWNYNVITETGLGMKDVVIDYSEDGVEWSELGSFQFEEASGFSDYEGFEGPNFMGVNAQYVLITGLSNWESTGCIGLSEILFDVDGTDISVNDEELISFNVYPNPAADNLFLTSIHPDINTIKIVDALGKEWMSFNQNTIRNTLDISSFASGIYFIVAYGTGGTTSTKKFIKK